MLRGSRPGERRGGRKRDTPNRRTILADRILTIGLDHPTASRRALLRKLAKDRTLPADIRMAVAPKCFPAKPAQSRRTGRQRILAGVRTTEQPEAKAGAAETSEGADGASPNARPQVLDALFGIVQEITAAPKARRRAALKIAEFLLPKTAKKAKALPDEYGFTVNPHLAAHYRDIELQVRSLENQPSRIIPANAEKLRKLKARADAIRRRLQVPCPTKYGYKQVANDYFRLLDFTGLRDETSLLPRNGRPKKRIGSGFDVFATSPESVAQRRRQELQDAERRSYNRGEGIFLPATAFPQRPKRFELLRWLYAKHKSNDEPVEPEIHGCHPFLPRITGFGRQFLSAGLQTAAGSISAGGIWQS